MFEQSFIADGKTRRERTIVFALVLQALGVTGLALLPLISAETIEAGKRFVLLPPTRAKPQPPDAHPTALRGAAASTRIFRVDSVQRPFLAPTRVVALEPGDAPTLASGFSSDTSSNTQIAGDILGPLVAQSSPPPVRPPPSVKPPHAPVRVSSRMTESQLLFGPKPAYPKLVLSARIEGTVRLQATISRDGRIENLHVLSGHPLLAGPALAAVRDWRYRPLLLNGDPVEVLTEIDVNFTLTGNNP